MSLISYHDGGLILYGGEACFLLKCFEMIVMSRPVSDGSEV